MSISLRATASTVASGIGLPLSSNFYVFEPRLRIMLGSNEWLRKSTKGRIKYQWSTDMSSIAVLFIIKNLETTMLKLLKNSSFVTFAPLNSFIWWNKVYTTEPNN